jgi:multimeric flavodoxin WrbA
MAETGEMRSFMERLAFQYLRYSPGLFTSVMDRRLERRAEAILGE